MPKFEAIESRRWKGPDGQTASLYGAVPWSRESDRGKWILETVGWTVRNNVTGTIGIGRLPFSTKQEVENWITQYLARNSH